MYIYIYTHIVIGHAGNGSPLHQAALCAFSPLKGHKSRSQHNAEADLRGKRAGAHSKLVGC